jgi:hypothetical protein
MLTMPQELIVKKSELSTQELQVVLSEIAYGMRQVVNATIETALIIAKHQGKGYWDQVEDVLLNRVQWFDASILSMYKKIGNNAALQSEKNREKLPPSYNTLYHLAFSDPQRLNAALEKGKINQKTTLEQAKKFSAVDKKQRATQSPRKAKSLTISVSIKVPSFSESKLRVLRNTLAKFKMEIEKQGGVVKWTEF